LPVQPSTDDPASAVRAATRYLEGRRPLFTRLPISYRFVPLPVRIGMLSLLARVAREDPDAFPAWPVESRIDAAPSRIDYAGRRAAFVLTHDVDSHGELDLVEPIRQFERSIGLPSAWGFVPEISWPTEEVARSLVAEGCEVYCHDVGHDGRLPYLDEAAIRDAFARIDDASPWARELVRTFRAGQLLTSPTLMRVVGERFSVDMSIPDTERSGPYGGRAGCGTVVPFRYGNVFELPLTLPQDVFARHVYGYSADETLQLWTRKLDHIVATGGVAVMVLHPTWSNPARPDLWEAIRAFLERIVDRDDVLLTTPMRLASDVFGVDA
jgi:hypothetical protein